MGSPNLLIEIIPHVDNSLKAREPVRYFMGDIELKGAWGGPAALELFRDVIADVARLPVFEMLGRAHFAADLMLRLGEVIHDYLAEAAADG